MQKRKKYKRKTSQLMLKEDAYYTTFNIQDKNIDNP